MKKILDFVFHYVVKNNLKTKFHGWGMTNPEFMKRYPFYSVDSTGWLAGGQFNTLMFFDQKIGKIVSTNSKKLRKTH